MCHMETYILQVMAEELIFIEQALLGLVQVQQHHNDTLSSLLHRVYNLRPPSVITPPTLSSSIRTRVYNLHPHPVITPPTPGSSNHTRVSLSPPPTRSSTPVSLASTSGMTPSPLPVVGDRTLPDQAQSTEDADSFEL